MHFAAKTDNSSPILTVVLFFLSVPILAVLSPCSLRLSPFCLRRQQHRVVAGRDFINKMGGVSCIRSIQVNGYEDQQQVNWLERRKRKKRERSHASRAEDEEDNVNLIYLFSYMLA